MVEKRDGHGCAVIGLRWPSCSFFFNLILFDYHQPSAKKDMAQLETFGNQIITLTTRLTHAGHFVTELCHMIHVGHLFINSWFPEKKNLSLKTEILPETTKDEFHKHMGTYTF